MTNYFGRAAIIASTLVPAWTSAQAADPPPIYKPVDRPIVIGWTRVLRSTVLGDERRINVYLPEHINMPGRRFPVLVLLDGGVKEDFLHIAGLTQITAAWGEGEEIILVGVEGVDRRHDLTSASSIQADRKVAPTSGGAAAYRRFLVDELKPWIDATFPNHGRTAVMGESLAGLFVLETMLREPAAFDDFVSVSPSLWWDDGNLVKHSPRMLRREQLTGRRLWVGFDKPAPPAIQAKRDRTLQDGLVSALRASAPKALWWRAVKLEEGHSSVYHPAALQALRTLYGKRAGVQH